VNGEYGQCSESIVFPYCTSEPLDKVHDTGITASLLTQPTLLAEATITCRLVIPLLNAAFRRSVPMQILTKGEPLLPGEI
jgi:hypothetical protein